MTFDPKTVDRIRLTMRYLNKSKFIELANEYIQIGYIEVFEMKYIAFYKNWNLGAAQNQEIGIWTELKMEGQIQYVAERSKITFSSAIPVHPVFSG